MTILLSLGEKTVIVVINDVIGPQEPPPGLRCRHPQQPPGWLDVAPPFVCAAPHPPHLSPPLAVRERDGLRKEKLPTGVNTYTLCPPSPSLPPF